MRACRLAWTSYVKLCAGSLTAAEHRSSDLGVQQGRARLAAFLDGNEPSDAIETVCKLRLQCIHLVPSVQGRP